MQSGCERFLGLHYQLGADGSNGKIDCIHLVLAALDEMGIPRPAVQADWYARKRRMIFRDLYRWGERIERPVYDGDVVLIPEQDWAFGVTWQQGILHISQALGTVNWCPLRSAPPLYAFRCCLTRSS